MSEYSTGDNQYVYIHGDYQSDTQFYYKIEQNILGLDKSETALNYIKIKNPIVYLTSPSRNNDMNVNPDEFENGYIPNVSIKCDYLLVETFRNMLNIFRKPSFFVKYYDTELDKFVLRHMYASNIGDVEFVYSHDNTGYATDIIATTSLTIDLVSCEAYKYYADLSKEVIWNETDQLLEVV